MYVKNIVITDKPPLKEITENIFYLDMPPLEDILENTLDPNMPPLEDIFDDDVSVNDNIMHHNNTKPAPKVGARDPDNPVEIHNINTHKEIKSHKKMKYARSAS